MREVALYKLLLILLSVVCSAYASAGTAAAQSPSIAGVVGPIGAGDEVISVRSISLHPWFGAIGNQWDPLFSALVDKIVEQKADGSFATVPSLTLTGLMLGYLDYRKAQASTGPADPVNPARDDLKSKIDGIKTQLGSEENSAKRLKLKHSLQELQQQLLMFDAENPRPPRDVDSALLENLMNNIDTYKINEKLLLSDSKPRMSELSLASGWTSAKLDVAGCVDFQDPVHDPSLTLDNMSAVGEIKRVRISRVWLIGPLLTSTSNVVVSASKLPQAYGDLQQRKLFRISELIVSRKTTATGSYPADFYTSISGEIGGKAVNAGCISVFPTKGVGFEAPLAIPLPSANGAINFIPQIVGAVLTPIPSISVNNTSGAQ